MLALLSAPILADSIDEAEAKRRGVPVTQVQAENALAKEKEKSAALEKQIADLQKQIAALNNPGGSETAGAAAAAGSAPAGVDDGETHLVQMYRPIVRDTYQTHITLERSYTATKTPPGGRPDTQTVSLKANIVGTFNVSSVSNGQPTQMLLNAEKFTINGHDEFPPNTPIFIQPDIRAVDFSPPMNVHISGEAQQVLDLLYRKLDPTPPNEDDIYGSKTAHKVGEEWPVNSELAARQLSLISGMELNPAGLTGKAKIVGIEMVDGAKALRVKISIDVKNLTPHSGYTLVSGSMHGSLSRLVPITPTLRLPEASVTADISLVENSPTNGKYDVKVHIVRSDVNAAVAKTK